MHRLFRVQRLKFHANFAFHLKTFPSFSRNFLSLLSLGTAASFFSIFTAFSLHCPLSIVSSNSMPSDKRCLLVKSSQALRWYSRPYSSMVCPTFKSVQCQKALSPKMGSWRGMRWRFNSRPWYNPEFCIINLVLGIIMKCFRVIQFFLLWFWVLWLIWCHPPNGTTGARVWFDARAENLDPSIPRKNCIVRSHNTCVRRYYCLSWHSTNVMLLYYCELASKWAKNLSTFLSRKQYLGLKAGADFGRDFPYVAWVSTL